MSQLRGEKRPSYFRLPGHGLRVRRSASGFSYAGRTMYVTEAWCSCGNTYGEVESAVAARSLHREHIEAVARRQEQERQLPDSGAAPQP